MTVVIQGVCWKNVILLENGIQIREKTLVKIEKADNLYR